MSGRGGAGGPLGAKTSGPGALLAASVLSFCFLLAGAQSGTTTIAVDPAKPIEGQRVTLRPAAVPANALVCRWFRGAAIPEHSILEHYILPDPVDTNGPLYTGRESVDSDCSLHITNLNGNDTGTYTVNIGGPGISETGEVDVVVSEMLSSPILTSSEYLPLEKENVTLECNTSSGPEVTISWYKDGQPVPTNAIPSGNSRSLTIYNFTRADDGNYTCVAENAASNATSKPVVITMAYGPDKVKINQSGNITQRLDSQLVLVCSADSNPAAQFRWFFNNSDTSVTNETFLVGPVTWQDGGNYTCQACNTRTNLTASASVFVTVTSDDLGNNGGLSGGAIAGIVIGCVAGVILIGGLLYFVCTKTSLGRTERHVSNGKIPSAPGHNQGITDTKPRTGEEDIRYSTLAFNANNPPQPAPGAAQPPDSTIIYSEIKKK